MTERLIGPKDIVGVTVQAGEITRLTIKMVDGSRQDFIPAVEQPAPVEHYIGKHERTIGGYKYGGTRTQLG